MKQIVESYTHSISKYSRIWWLMTVNTSQQAFTSRSGVIFFTTGKVARFLFFLLFLFLIISHTKTVGDYTLWQMVFFFVTFNLVDIMAQFFLREVYRFRQYVVTGSLDYILTKPFSPLFRSLFGGSDVLDLLTFLPLIGFIFYTIDKLHMATLQTGFLYTLLIFNAFLIAIAFHIGVLALGVMTTEVDNAIWIFRDMSLLGRIPVDIYRQPVSFIVTFIIPVGIMMTFPAKALMGVLSFEFILIAFSVSSVLLFISYSAWKYSLRKYSSASS